MAEIGEPQGVIINATIDAGKPCLLKGNLNAGNQHVIDDAQLHVGIPAIIGRLNGKDGKSAYEIAVDHGFVGTEEEWLLSLIGPEGKSAYEVAVENGYTGTVEQWLEDMKPVWGKIVGNINNQTDLMELFKNLDDKISSSTSDADARIKEIEKKIPAEASETNKLADKNYLIKEIQALRDDLLPLIYAGL